MIITNIGCTFSIQINELLMIGSTCKAWIKYRYITNATTIQKDLNLSCSLIF